MNVMIGMVEFQAYLLSQMRARSRSDEALASLGFAREDLPVLRDRMEAHFPPGHTVEAYRELLGPPASEELTGEVGYRTRIWRYSLPVWPDLEFAVFSGSDGVVGDLIFARQSLEWRIPDVSWPEWSPWSYTESELLEAYSTLAVCEDWPPLRDYKGSIAGKTLIVMFDFGLLQRVEELRT